MLLTTKKIRIKTFIARRKDKNETPPKSLEMMKPKLTSFKTQYMLYINELP